MQKTHTKTRPSSNRPCKWKGELTILSLSESKLTVTLALPSEKTSESTRFAMARVAVSEKVLHCQVVRI